MGETPTSWHACKNTRTPGVQIQVSHKELSLSNASQHRTLTRCDVEPKIRSMSFRSRCPVVNLVSDASSIPHKKNKAEHTYMAKLKHIRTHERAHPRWCTPMHIHVAGGAIRDFFLQELGLKSKSGATYKVQSQTKVPPLRKPTLNTTRRSILTA